MVDSRPSLLISRLLYYFYHEWNSTGFADHFGVQGGQGQGAFAHRATAGGKDNPAEKHDGEAASCTIGSCSDFIPTW